MTFNPGSLAASLMCLMIAATGCGLSNATPATAPNTTPASEPATQSGISPADAKLIEAGKKVRAAHRSGGLAMWQALAELVHPGMTVRQMKLVLPPCEFIVDDGVTYRAGGVIWNGGTFLLSYALDNDFGLEAGGYGDGSRNSTTTATASGREDITVAMSVDDTIMVLSDAPKIIPTKKIFGRMIIQPATAPATAPANSPATQPEVISPNILKPLMDDLDSDDATVRIAAISRLGSYGSGATPATKRLCELLSDQTVVRSPDNTRKGFSECSISRAARRALVQIGRPAVPGIKEAIKSSKDQAREQAAEALAEIGGTMDEVWAWAIDDKDSSVNVRQLAARQLGKSQGEVAQAGLIKGLRDDSIDVRREAVGGLGRVGKKDAVVPLVAILGDEQLGTRAAGSLGQIGAPAVAALIAAIDDPKFAGKDNAQNALIYMKDSKAMALLLEALKHRNPLVRASAAESMSHSDAPEATEALIALTQDAYPRVRWSAYYALSWIGGDRHGAQFVKVSTLARKALQEDTDPKVRASAAQCLGSMLVEVTKNQDALIVALKDGSPVVRTSAAAGCKDIKSIKPLIDLLHDDDIHVRRQAVQTLGRIGSNASEATGEIVRMLKDKDWLIRNDAATALGYIGDPTATQPGPK